MANCYTDLDKWDDDWFISLTPVWKCVWQYLCDNVKGCGEQKLSFTKLSLMIGAKIERLEFDKVFEGRIFWISDDELWVPGTTWRLYKTLSPKVPAHINAAKKILRITDGIELSRRGLEVRERFCNFLKNISQSEPDQGLARPQSGPDLKEKGIKNKDKNKEGGVGETNSPPGAPPNDIQRLESRLQFDLPALFDRYPRPEKKTAALTELSKRIKTQSDYDDWWKAITNYAKVCTQEKRERKYILTFPSFVLEWQDWRDYAQSNSAQAASQARIALSEQGDAWATQVISARKDGGLGLQNAMREMPPDLAELVEISFGTWRSIPTADAEREIRVTLAMWERQRSQPAVSA